VDAREQGEYLEAHIPGAELLPLSAVEAGEVQLTPAEHTIFYCRSGNRSMRAATALVQRGALDAAQAYNLVGGINAFDGLTLPELPRLKVFPVGGQIDEVLLRAMELEKGASLFYAELSRHFVGTPQAQTVQKLARAEVSHASLLHQMLKAGGSEPFEPFFERLDGQLLESGESMSAVASRIAGWEVQREAALLELALEMEFSAYDLYRAMAATSGPQLEQTFLELAAQEQVHARALLGELSQLTGRA